MEEESSKSGRIVRILISIGVVAALLAVVFWPTKKATVSPSNYIVGPTGAKVSIIEYGDFQCPACAQFYPLVEQVKEKYKDQIVFQFRNFPLTSIHPKAQSAHRAAVAAGNQGKFFEMYNKLYQGQQIWSSVPNEIDTFENYAKELTLDIDKYKKDYSATETNDLINADVAEGKKLGISGTPAFVINGELIKENREIDDVEKFSKKIDELLAKQ